MAIIGKPTQSPPTDRMLEVVSEILEVSIGISRADEPLARMGLDSLKSMELQEEIGRNFGVRIPIVRFSAVVTVHQLVEYLSDSEVVAYGPSLDSVPADIETDNNTPNWVALSHVDFPAEGSFEFRFPEDGWWAPDEEAIAAIEQERRRFPKTIAAMERCAQRGDQPGAQLYIAQRGKVLLSMSFGMAEAGRKMTNDTLVPWLCSGKPLYSIAFGQLWERELIELDMPVGEVLPKFGTYGKDRITFTHLLSHSSGLKPDPVYGHWRKDRDEILSVICNAELSDAVTPGLRAYYSGMWAWFVLAEAIEALDGREIRQYMQDEIFRPLGLQATRLWVDDDEFRAIRHRIAPLWQLPPHSRAFPLLSSQQDFARRLPGVVGMGTAHDIGRIYEALIPRAYSGRASILRNSTADALIAPRRVALYDAHYASYVSYGLGVVSEGWHFGDYCSPRTFGHQGNFSNFIVADPAHELVIAALPNGMCTTPRDREVVHAVYEDLGIDLQSQPTAKVTQTIPEQDPDWMAIAGDEHFFWGPPDARDH